MLEAVQSGHKRVAIKSGHGPGKTTVSALIGLWRAMRYADALTVVTAPTLRQCKDWLAEVRKHVERADPIVKKLVDVQATGVRIAGRPKWGVEILTATTKEGAQGKHNDHLTVIFEEASGVKRGIVEVMEGAVTNEDSLTLKIGNPTLRDSDFFDCFNLWRHRWETITLNTEQSPIVSKQQLEYLADKYGRDSDVYRMRVLGEFPLADPTCVISSEDAEACTKTDLYSLCLVRRSDGSIARQFGIDLSRFGGDESVIYRRTGNAIVERAIFHRTDPNVVVQKSFLMQTEAGWRDEDTWFVPDAGGMGQGVMYRFHEAGKQVFEFHNGGVSSQAEYDNAITEAWFGVGRLLKNKQAYFPLDNRLIQQLSTRQYHITSKGKLIVESKEDYKKRMQAVLEEGGSPDRADAFVMAFYDQVLAQVQTGTRAPNKRLGVRR